MSKSVIILDYIEKQISNDSEALDEHDDLLGSGLIDSLGMMKLIVFIENEFKIKVPSEDMIIENFMTVNHIDQYLSKQVN